MQTHIQEAVKKALDGAPERNFVESVELSFTIRDIDLKNPANRIQEEVRLPQGRGKPLNIAMFAGGEMAIKARDAGLVVIEPAQIEDLGSNKQAARKLAGKHDFFLSEIPHMADIGRHLGVVLGPRGKMPRPVPPNIDPANIALALQSTTLVRSRDNITFHTVVGARDQGEAAISENAYEVWNRVTGKFERGAGNVRSLYVKTSMGPSVKVEVKYT